MYIVVVCVYIKINVDRGLSENLNSPQDSLKERFLTIQSSCLNNYIQYVYICIELRIMMSRTTHGPIYNIIQYNTNIIIDA